MAYGNKQPRNFAVFLLTVAAVTSLVYHVSNRDWISLASAERHAAAGRYAEALPVYEKLAENDFQPDTVYMRLAECYFSLGRPLQARAALKLLAAGGKRDDPKLMLKLAASGLWLGLFEEAAGEYSEALRLEPDNRPARFGLARALAWSGRFEEAVHEYRILLEGK